LYEFWLLENPTYEKWTDIKAKKYFSCHFQITEVENIFISEMFAQKLTHQLIQAQFIRIQLPAKTFLTEASAWVSKKQIQKLPFPKIIHEYLKTENFL
jgi:hypothetical protein